MIIIQTFWRHAIGFHQYLIDNVYCILQLCVGDELPDKVCAECMHQVNISYNFKLQCETSDVTLRQMLLKPEVRYCTCVYWGR
jgi:hypothetical protein